MRTIEGVRKRERERESAERDNQPTISRPQASVAFSQSDLPLKSHYGSFTNHARLGSPDDHFISLCYSHSQ